MPAGRKRKSAAAKIAAGNPGHRQIPIEVDFSGAGEIGKPPAWLDAGAKREFNRIVAALADMDILHGTDVAILSSYAVAYSRWVASEQQVAKEGTTLTVTGSTGQTKVIKHPALMVSSESQKQMLRAGSLLGLNPCDRNKLSVSPKDVANPFATLMGGGDDED